MSELRRIQRTVQSYLRAPASGAAQAALANIVATGGSVAREVRLHIYANAYRARLVDALSVDFAGLHAYLGDDAFAELVSAYIARHPSRYFSLREVGGQLAAFLQATAPYAQHIELQDLAQFEWALCHAFDAASAGCASSSDFAALAPERWPELKLQFVPALCAIALRSNAPALWKALSAEQKPPAVELLAEPQGWIVWRRDLKLLFRPLDAVERIALEVFTKGAAFGEMCVALADKLPEPEIPSRAAALMQQWLQEGLLAGVESN